MSNKVKVLRDKHKSPTSIYPKVNMNSLTSEVKQYIESQGVQEETRGNITTKIFIDKWGDVGIASVMQAKKDNTHLAECRVFGNKTGDNDVYGAEISYQEGNTLATVSVDKSGVLLSGINADININTTGESKLYINGVEYQAGGGSQLYQHNVIIYRENVIDAILTIINDSDTKLNTLALLATYIHGKLGSSNIMASGKCLYSGSTYLIINGVYCSANDIITVYGITEGESMSSLWRGFLASDGLTIADIVYAI